MTLRRGAPIAIILMLGFAGGSRAQMPPQGTPPCMAEFVPLRTEAEKRASLIKAAGERHAPPQELCQLFTRYSEAEEKVVKFIDVHASSCGIPQQVLTTTKANHTKTGEMRQRICSVAAPGERRGPGLGEALGMRAVPTPDTTSTGKGTLDTLSGNALAR
jgi:hypothetical protein